VAATGQDELDLEAAVRSRLTELRLAPQLERLLTVATTKASWSVMSLLALPRIAESPALTAAALGALQAKASGTKGGRLTNADALSVGNELKNTNLGAGLLTLESNVGGVISPRALANLASNDAWRKLDDQAQKASGAQLSQLSSRLVAPPVQEAAEEVVEGAVEPGAEGEKAGGTQDETAKPLHAAAPADAKPASPSRSSKLAEARLKAAASAKKAAKKPGSK
jgi:hypothetical protein